MTVSWGPWRALLALLGSFFLAGAVSAFLPPWGASLALGATFLGVALLLGSPRELGLRRPQGNWFLATAAAVALFWVLSTLFALLDPPSNQPALLDELGPLPLQIFLVAVLAPVSEEVLFRGVLFAGFLQKMPVWLAAGLSALLFALPHLPSGLALLPLLGALGFILALLYWRTDSLWPPIFVHALNNSLALVALA